MGNHRADRRGLSRRPSVTSTPIEVAPQVPSPAVVPLTGPGKRRATSTAPATRVARSAAHSRPRGPLFKGLPSAPVLLGVTALAISTFGAVTAADPVLVGSGLHSGLHQASALGGSSASSSTSLLDDREAAVSRDSRRDALADAASAELLDAAEAQAQQRNATLAQMADKAQAFSDKLALNAWVYPTDPVVLTARFGEYGLWSSYHTGLDFNGNTGDPIHAIAGGTVTSVGYDGSYGNKTVITLDDGTEIWYCHQTSQYVSEGDTVTGDQVIGTVGSTGHVTGSHLHVEVRPGGGDPVDPYAAFVVHGVTP